jgi:acetyl esterase/lipase
MTNPPARITRGRLLSVVGAHAVRLLPARPRRQLLGRAPCHFAAKLSFGDLHRFLETGGPAVSYVLDTSDPVGVLRAYPELADVTVQEVRLGPGRPPARLYTGPDTSPRSALVWTHGGAFVSGTLDANESHWVALSLAARGHPVLAVDYRKALHGVRHPLPGDDMAAGWSWAAGRAADIFGLPPHRLHLGGASAGANLAACVVRRLLDDGSPLPASLLLAYPILHSSLFPWNPADLAVVRRAAGNLYFSPDVIADACLNYAGADFLTDHRAFPGEAPVDEKHPPTLVLTCEHDSLRTSGELYVEELRAVGVTTVHHRIPGARHGCLARPATPQARQAADQLVAWLNQM